MVTRPKSQENPRPRLPRSFASWAGAFWLGAFWAVCGLVLLLAGHPCRAGDTKAGDTPAADIRAEYRRPADIPFPDDNPYSAAKATLGRALFFDPMLSGSGSHSCATCHIPRLSWGDGLARAVGWGGQALPLRSPTLLNVAWLSILGWDGKFEDLESVAFAPLLAPSNMHQTEPERTLQRS